MQGYKTYPVIIGSESNFIPEDERILPELSHEWRCYVKSVPGLIKAVQFRLHESFKNPYININSSPFEIIEHGWGEFTVQLKITLFNDDKVNTNHYLKLHGSKYPVISEKMDTICYKGDETFSTDGFTYKYENDDEEYLRIDNGINYILDLFENQPNK